jgi:hypothetical protein
MDDANYSHFNTMLTPNEKMIITGLDSPYKIFQFLDKVEYYSGDRNRSVINVLRERQAHCLDGGLFAATMLYKLGFPAVIIDLLPEPGTDEDHILAVFQQNNLWGCVAKSNFTGLRYRDPVYSSLRDLVLSFLEVYFNRDGFKTLRSYTRPIQLKYFNQLNWLVDDHAVDEMETHIKTLTSTPLLSKAMISSLSRVDKRTYDAGILSAGLDWVYKE